MGWTGVNCDEPDLPPKPDGPHAGLYLSITYCQVLVVTKRHTKLFVKANTWLSNFEVQGSFLLFL